MLSRFYIFNLFLLIFAIALILALFGSNQFSSGGTITKKKLKIKK